MRICIFEDRAVANLDPLTATRPAFELWCGQTDLAAKQFGFFAPCEVGFVVRPMLADLVGLDHPGTRVNDVAWLRAKPTVVVNARWLPPPGSAADLSDPCVAMIGEEVVYAVVGPDQLACVSPDTLEDCLESWKKSLPHRSTAGRLIAYPWELVHQNAEQLCVDFHPRPGHPSSDWAVVGSREQLFVEPTARIDPLVVFDTSGGPVVIDHEAVIAAFSRIEGPCYIGPGTHVLGAKIRAGTTLGRHCRIGGEVEASIVHGYSNKYHDGFLGHAYVGEWVNLGAGTTNSDLRNDYGEVSVTINGRPVATGLNKVGCFIGDHVKTGLGTLLNTGSNIGAFANLLPSGTLLPKYIPAYASWWHGTLSDRADLPLLLSTAATVMQRRGRAFSASHAELYQTLFEQTAAERRRVVREMEQRRLRRSA
jgi:UDP-N-acetylglucosamine diphosphorylase/glucosamine-1-phosphate N-acetyltransferase